MERKYYNREFTAEDLAIVEREIETLKNHEITCVEGLVEFMEKYSELSAIVEETMAWKYINMTRFADKEEYSRAFNEYYGSVVAALTKGSFYLNKKIYENDYFKELPEERYENYKRILKNEIEIYDERNVELGVKETELANKYGEIMSQVSVEFRGEEHTLLGMKKYMYEADRGIREEAWRKKYEALKGENDKLNELFDKLVELRVEMAANKEFNNYRDYMHEAKGRFSYTPEDLYEFHTAVEKTVVPFLAKLNREKAEKLGIPALRPWDVDVSVDGRKLKPFEKIEEFIDRGIDALAQVKEEFGEKLKYMRDNEFLDLDNRKGKAPGGYNYPLYESGVPFIFMNAVGVHQDVVTLMHEAGHAMHSFATREERLLAYQDCPSEVAELASMSMEFMSMDAWKNYYPDGADCIKARKDQIMRSLETLPWVMIVDAYQHWIYLNPENTKEEREEHFRELMERFNPGIDWSCLDVEKGIAWINQLHIFEVPFYYIEYAISQLGAIGMYMNYKRNPEKALGDYENFLALGYCKSIEKIYETAGLKFDFSEGYIRELVDFLAEELEDLEKRS